MLIQLAGGAGIGAAWGSLLAMRMARGQRHLWNGGWLAAATVSVLVTLLAVTKLPAVGISFATALVITALFHSVWLNALEKRSRASGGRDDAL